MLRRVDDIVEQMFSESVGASQWSPEGTITNLIVLGSSSEPIAAEALPLIALIAVTIAVEFLDLLQLLLGHTLFKPEMAGLGIDVFLHQLVSHLVRRPPASTPEGTPYKTT